MPSTEGPVNRTTTEFAKAARMICETLAGGQYANCYETKSVLILIDR
jgi:hypothetical protein